MRALRVLAGLALLCTVRAFPTEETKNSIADAGRGVSATPKRLVTSDDLLSEVYENCFEKDTMSCIRTKFLLYIDGLVKDKRAINLSPAVTVERNGKDAEEEELSGTELEDALGRDFGGKDDYLDGQIVRRVAKFLRTRDFKLHLPELFFDGAIISFTPNFFDPDGPNFSIEFPDDGRKLTEARTIMKKLLLPLMLAMKLKMKALMPLAVGLIGLKSLKAVILSKIALIWVAVLTFLQLCKKGGMMAPAVPMFDYQPYHAAASANEPSYDSYSAPPASANGGGPYSRVWTPHHHAYRGYYDSWTPYNQQQQQQTAPQQPSQQQPQ